MQPARARECVYIHCHTASGSARGGGHFLCLRLVTFHTDIVSSMKDYRFSHSCVRRGHIMFVTTMCLRVSRVNDILFADNDETSAVLFAI